MLPEAASRGSILKFELTVFHTIRTDPKPENNLFMFSSLSQITFIIVDYDHESVTVTMGRDRKIPRTALRTNPIAEFVSVSSRSLSDKIK